MLGYNTVPMNAKVVTNGAAALQGEYATSNKLATIALWVATAGNVVVVMQNEANDANTVSFNNVVAGTLLPMNVRKVISAPANTIALTL